MPNTPLHDGGAIIEEDRVKAASCLFPLSQSPSLSRTLGTRHRAGLGLSEETDAVILIVSEETGMISIAVRGKLTKELDLEKLKKVLTNLCRQAKKKEYKKLPLFNKLR
jgi:diadenylate cyclase